MTKNTGSLPRLRLQLLGLMYFSYAVTMFLKASIPVISPALLSDPDVAMTKTQFGAILAYGSLGGLVGKFVFGWTSDRFGGKVTFLIGLLFTSIGLAIFGLTHQHMLFVVIFFSIALAKAAGWPAMTKLIGQWYKPSQYGRVWGLISTASRSGAILASLGLGALLLVLSWQQILWLCAVLGVLTSVVWFLAAHESPPEESRDEGEEEALSPGVDPNHPLAGTTLRQALRVFATSKRVWLIFVGMAGLTTLTDFQSFVPLFLTETLGLSTSQAAMTGSAFPIGALIAVLGGGILFDSLSPARITKLVGVALLVSVLNLLVLLNLVRFGLSDTANIVVVFGCLFSFGFCISPAYYLPMSIFSIKFGGPHSGVLVCILDIGGYAGGVAFALAAGILADQADGWNKVLTLLVIVAAASLGLMVAFLRGESKASPSVSETSAT